MVLQIEMGVSYFCSAEIYNKLKFIQELAGLCRKMGGRIQNIEVSVVDKVELVNVSAKVRTLTEGAGEGGGEEWTGGRVGSVVQMK